MTACPQHLRPIDNRSDVIVAPSFSLPKHPLYMEGSWCRRRQVGEGTGVEFHFLRPSAIKKNLRKEDETAHSVVAKPEYFPP